MNHREVPLDGVRGLAILLVFLHHVGIYGGLEGRTPLDRLVVAGAGPLWLGVDLFFVLSGFLITGILVEAKGSPLYFRSFYGRRILRIFPLYYGFLAFALILFPSRLPPDTARSLLDSQAWYWLYLSNVQVALYGWQDPLHLGHFWSLAVEEQFYLLWPLAVWTLGRKSLMRLAAACFIVALVLRILMPFGMTPTGAYVLLPARMDSLAAGAMLALARGGLHPTRTYPRYSGVALIASLVAFLILHSPYHPLALGDEVRRAVRHTVIAVGCVSLIALVLASPRRGCSRRAFSARPLVFLGKYSYGLYVIHLPIILFAAGAGWRADAVRDWWGSQVPGLALFAAGTAAVSIAGAVVVYHVWEAPFLRLKRYLPYREPPIGPQGSRAVD